MINGQRAKGEGRRPHSTPPTCARHPASVARRPNHGAYTAIPCQR